MRGKTQFFVLPTLLVALIDQITKSVAVSKLDPGYPFKLFWTLQLNLTRNSGASFSMGSNLTPYIASAAILAALGIIYIAWKEKKPAILCFYGIVLGGVLGNVTDRVVRSGDGFLGGEVVDFIDFQWWPIFNVADMALVIGLPILMLLRYQDENSDD